MTELVLLRGVYGSSKGWIARGLVRSRGELGERWMHVAVRPEPAKGRVAQHQARATAYLLAEHKALQALRDDISVVLSGVFMKADSVMRVVEAARNAGATRCRVVFCPQVRNWSARARALLRTYEKVRHEETYHEGIFDR